MGYAAANLGQVINNGIATLSGDSNVGMSADTTSSITNDGEITLSGANSTGMRGLGASQLVNDGTLTLTGPSSVGIDISQGSSATNNNTVYVMQGTGINVDGTGTTLLRAGNVTANNGVAGIRLANGAQLALNSTDDITTNGTAHALLLDSGSTGLSLNGTILNVQGSGNGIENAAETNSITLQNAQINVNDGSGIRTATSLNPANTVQVNVAGSGNGINFSQANGDPATGDLVLSNGYVVDVTGAGGNGLVINTLGNVNTAASSTISSINGGAALLVRNAGSVLNTGVLTSSSLTSPVIDLTPAQSATLENRGTVTASSATATAIAGSSGNDGILLSSGSVIGDVNTGAGDDLVMWNGGTLNGSLTLGAGNNNRAEITGVDLSQTRHITSDTGTDNQLSFSAVTARGGSFAADDLSRGVNLGNGWNVINFTNGTQWELTGNLQLAHSNVNIDSSSVLLAGNSVNPVISGGEPQSVIVTNSGVIDLTNGTGSPGNQLTLDGDLVSNGGAIKLQTALNEGGPLANQSTDRVLINGNAASGTTLLDVTPTAASVGALTDLNRDGIMDANEGISLVQVGGNATAGSFALKGDYVAAGPWRYDLYNFAPGSSDASQRLVGGATTGSNYWDYRLGNTYVCENGCTPVPPPPPVEPSTGNPGDGAPPVTGTTPPPPSIIHRLRQKDVCVPHRRSLLIFQHHWDWLTTTQQLSITCIADWVNCVMSSFTLPVILQRCSCATSART